MSKSNGETSIEKFEEKEFNYFFKHIEFLEFEESEKDEVATSIIDSARGDTLYWWQILLSGVIATLGLLHNSAAVVIGAMLVAPLFRPINGVCYGIAKGGRKVFIQSLKVFFISILSAVVIGFLITKLSGLNIETKEILNRVNPNIIDFFIAIFSAIVAVLSIKYDRFGRNTVVGVALSVSLILPLSVVGIELAIGNFVNSLGALMLFGANIVAVLVVTTIFFWLYGFVPHKLKSQAKAFKRLVMVLFLVVFIIVPLVFSFVEVKENNEISNQTKIYLENIIGEDITFCTVSDVNVIKNTKDEIYLSAILKIPEGYDVNDIYKVIGQTLDEEFDKKAVLDLEIIRITTIKTNV